MDFFVERIPGSLGAELIRTHHYTRSCHNGPVCFGLWRDPVWRAPHLCLGVCAFACPCSEAVRASVFGADEKDRVIELHRLWVAEWDDRPANLTSWFAARAILGMVARRPQTRAVISYADTTEGHSGGIYRALNFTDCGLTEPRRFFRDEGGALRHPRQSGVNITPGEAAARGWSPEARGSKRRFVLVVGSRLERRRWSRRLLWAPDQSAL